MTASPHYRAARAQEILADDPAVIANDIVPGEITDDIAVMTMVVRADQANSHGICHGGLLLMLADTTAAYALNTAETASLWVTSTCTAQFLRPARLGEELRATCRLVWDGGGRSRLYDTAVTNPAGEVVLLMRAQMTRLAAAAEPA
ncbi:MAG: hotdog fold thioesterase [Austwickia sp.]|nr:hotdog fold thioesterase [Austwickia sp.]MCO5309074.1 hotdog fold thioesterase [Austwickia sp.]